MTIELSRRLDQSEGVPFTQAPPAPVFNPVYSCQVLLHRLSRGVRPSIEFASSAKTIQILIFIIPPTFNTSARILNHRSFINKVSAPIAILPPAPSFFGICYEITRMPIKKIGATDTAQILVRGNTFRVNFLGVPTDGTKPLTVRFTNLSVSPVDKWFWDFGDSRFSTEKHPVHVYRKAGVYTVKLTAGDQDSGQVTHEKKGYIMVIEPGIGDIRLTFDLSKGYGDISVVNRDLDRDAGLETAVYISLFTDRRAEDTDILPNNQIDRRGWWADNTKGSRLWLLERESNLQEIVPKAEQYALEALNWLVEEEIAEAVFVEAFLQRTIPNLLLKIKIVQKSGDPLYFTYYYNWLAQTARSA